MILKNNNDYEQIYRSNREIEYVYICLYHYKTRYICHMALYQAVSTFHYINFPSTLLIRLTNPLISFLKSASIRFRPKIYQFLAKNMKFTHCRVFDYFAKFSTHDSTVLRISVESPNLRTGATRNCGRVSSRP
jgi:hypothetical protein